MRIYYGSMCLTRYDKSYGLDITPKCTQLLKRWNIPKNSIIRGELITKKDHEGFVDKRNYVSG